MNNEQRKKSCVLLGELGSGKTTIFNKICGTNEKANNGMESNTLKIAQHQSIQGLGFLLTDTPGVGSTENTFNHAVGILAALTDGPIDRILLVIKYHKRIDIVRKQIEKQIQIVKNYTQIITIIMTYWDECENKYEYSQKGGDIIRNQFNIRQIIYSSFDTTPKELCQSIDLIIYVQEKQKNQQQLTYSDQIFQKLMQFQEFDKELTKAKKQFISEFEQFYLTAKYFLSQFTEKTEQLDSILHGFTIFIRNQSKKVQEKFEKQNGKLMDELYNKSSSPEIAYAYLLSLKFSINEYVKDLTKIICSMMKFDNEHPLRQFRKCPQCKIIWYRPQGCDSMQCGDNSNIKIPKNEQKKIYQNFEFTYKQNEQNEQRITYKRLQNPNIQNQHIQVQSQIGFVGNIQFNVNDSLKQQLIYEQEKEVKKQIELYGSIGCRALFNWNDAELVDTEEIILSQEDMSIIFSVKDDLEFENYARSHIIQAQQEKKTIF